MELLRTTQEGILRAFALLLAQQSKPRQVKPKYEYRSFGTKIHAARRLTSAERQPVEDLLIKLKALDPRDEANDQEIKSVLKELNKHPVKFVPVKLAIKIDRSKTYPYRSKKRGG
jgi:hypothetical protein